MGNQQPKENWKIHMWKLNNTLFLFFLIIYPHLRTEGEREGEKHQLVASRMRPKWGPNPQPRHVP